MEAKCSIAGQREHMQKDAAETEAGEGEHLAPAMSWRDRKCSAGLLRPIDLDYLR
jgi:hypothetical protein